MKIFNNLEELVEFDKELAEELKVTFGGGDWESEQLYYHENKEEFAQYELTDGWYSHSGINDRDWNGAPDPLDYINLESLGKDLISTWDVSIHYLSTRGEVIQTSYGWW